MTKILIADDNDEVRSALKAVLARQPAWSVCGEAENGRKAVLLAHTHKPDLIILDHSMPMLSGLEAAAEILKVAPAVPIVLYTSHWSPQLDREATAIGIRKVISKGGKLDSFLTDIEGVLRRAPSKPQLDANAKPSGKSEPIGE